MEVIVLGADGTYPSPGGACSGYLVREGGFTLWMDAGNGTLARLQEHVPLEKVDAVFLSHLHPDHCVDIYPFYYALRFHPDGPLPHVPVYGPPGAVDGLGGLFMEESRRAFGEVFSWRTLGPGDVAEAGPLRLTVFPSVHSAPNLTLRVEAGGRVLCYSGDTGASPDLVRAARGADLFVCEASWQEVDPPRDPIHLRARETGRAAREAGAARLALTHIWPRHDPSVSVEEAAGEFAGPIEVAARGAVVALTRASRWSPRRTARWSL